MNKAKVKIYKEDLQDVSANFDGAEVFIKQAEELCDWKKIPVDKVNCFLV